ncbi:TonB-dependent receptor [Ignatzschineria sp. RMDPL8A]|uniref:TonB-dependent receptor plug domain-containing protein n=1 Tax=Ignatzschineria sp. RMDPL8A TaxID=2999236 RepID=UPI0024467C3F|nr:TonB-dependent receptor [Ignatzschineria sp. RMDPL8A]MDG9729573.1 TonB-dependent receptor [Ignatzschineria sp. RMDPL8A]
MTNQFKPKALIVALATLFSLSAHADESSQNIPQTDEEAIVFTANRIATDKDKTGTRTEVVSSSEIHQRQYRTVEEALYSKPGITLSRTSINGPSNLFIRGAGSQHSLVLVDGVPMGDAMGTGRMVDFTLLGRLNNIDRIEVLKGPQSTLYGSSAMGGVVQIFTKKGQKEPETVLSLEAGSRETIRTTLSTSGGFERFSYAIAGSVENQRGIDVTSNDDPLKPEKDFDKDRQKNRVLSGNMNFIVSENFDIDLMAHYNRQYLEYDAPGNRVYPDYMRNKQFLGRIAGNLSLFDDRLATTVAYSINDIKRDNYSGYDQKDHITGEYLGTEKSEYGFKGKIQSFDLNNVLTLNPNFKTAFGATYTHEKGSQDDWDQSKTTNMKSLYLDQHFDYNDRLFNTIGVRYDDHSEFGSKTTFRATTRFNVNDQVALKASYGTGFNAPNVYQMYGDWVGNKELKAETSRGFDLGIVFNPTTASEIEVTYFNTRYKNMIDYVADYPGAWTGKYENVDRAKMKGLEVAGVWQLNEMLGATFAYTYLDAKSKAPEKEYERMLRRPRHQVSAGLNYAPTERFNLNAGATYYSSRLDKDEVTLGGFTTLDVAATYQINESVEITAKINNLFDKKHEYAKGYREPGIEGFVGVNIKF